MSVTLPVIKATMGSRDYYISKMSAFELSGQVTVASELSDWHELTLNELYQRKLNEKRVEQDIAPYLATTADRFFGAIIVWVLDDSVAMFEPVSQYIEVPLAYRTPAESMGFLVIDSTRSQKESGLVALDGQHRFAAFRRVVQGQVDGPYAGKVREDEVAVIFVRDRDVRDARDLFTVLNRSARRVSKSDVLVMSEVDGAAIIARNLTSSSLLAPRGLLDKPLIKWERNTINQRDEELTTLNAIYEIVQIVAATLQVDLQAGEEAGDPPSEDDLARVEVETGKWLKSFFANSPTFEAMRHDPLLVVQARKESTLSLLLRPVGLQAFFGAVATALQSSGGKMKDLDEVIRRLLMVDWDIKSPFWRGTMVNARGNVTNKRNDVQLASDLAAWMITGKTSATQFQEDLLERYRKQLGRNDASLPTPLEIK